ncbi:hypothetical protein BH11MYX4_BH11MYX4_35800 [soil metagenome]
MSTTRALRSAALAALTSAAVACGSDATVDSAVAEPPIPLVLTTGSPGTLAIPLDGKASTSIDVSGGGGRNVELSAENVPSDVSVIFSPRVTTGTSTLIVTTNVTALAGPASIVLRAHEGARAASAMLRIEVVASKPALGLALAPDKATIRLGSSVGVGVHVDRSAGPSADVDVQLEGLPPGLSAAPITVPGTATEGVLTFTASSLAPAGTTVKLTVVAREGTLVRKAQLELGVVANAGDLDQSFGKGGIAYQPGYSTAQANNALQLASGNLLVTTYENARTDGHISLFRYLYTGLPDTAFGAGGRADVVIPGRSLMACEAAETYFNRLMVVGSSFADGEQLVTFVNVNSNGSLHAASGTNGAYVWPGAVGRAQSVIATKGKLLAIAPPQDGIYPMRLFRSSFDAVPDATFGTNGMKTLDAPPLYAPERLVELDGKAVVVGWSPGAPDTSDGDMVLVRLDGDGNVDPTFGTAGRLVIDFGLQDVAKGAALQKDGKLLVVGTAGATQSARSCAVARVDPDGKLDASFGNGGKVIAGTATVSECYGVTVQPDGKILAFGKTGAPDASAAVFRFDANGALDATFHGGHSTASFGGQWEWFSWGFALSNGKLLAVGEALDPLSGFGLARLFL